MADTMDDELQPTPPDTNDFSTEEGVNPNPANEEGVENVPTTNPEVATGSQNPGAPLRADLGPYSSVINNTENIAERQAGHGALNSTTQNVSVPTPVQQPLFQQIKDLNDSYNDVGNALVSGKQQEAAQNISGSYNAYQNSGNQQANTDTLNAAADLKNQLLQSQQSFNNYQNSIDQFTSLPNSGIDPSRFVNNMGVTDKTMTALGILIGGVGAGLTGGPNTALQTFQTRVQRDIDAQKVGNEQHLAALVQGQGLALGRVQLAANAFAAQSVAQHNVYSAIDGTLNYAMLNAKNQNEYQAAAALRAQYQQKLLQTDNDVARTFAGYTQNQDNFNAGVLGYVAAKAARDNKTNLQNNGKPIPTMATTPPSAPAPTPVDLGGYNGYLRNP